MQASAEPTELGTHAHVGRVRDAMPTSKTQTGGTVGGPSQSCNSLTYGHVTHGIIDRSIIGYDS